MSKQKQIVVNLVTPGIVVLELDLPPSESGVSGLSPGFLDFVRFPRTVYWEGKTFAERLGAALVLLNVIHRKGIEAIL